MNHPLRSSYLELNLPPAVVARLLGLPEPTDWQDMTVGFRAYANLAGRPRA